MVRRVVGTVPTVQCGAEPALPLVEPLPESLQSPVAEMAVSRADDRVQAVRGGTLDEPPQRAAGPAGNGVRTSAA